MELSLSVCNSYILESENTIAMKHSQSNWSGLPKLFKRLNCSIAFKTLIHTVFWSQNCSSAFDCQGSASEINSICTVLPTVYRANKNSFSLKKCQNSNIPMNIVHAKLISLEARNLSNDTVITAGRELSNRFLPRLS